MKVRNKKMLETQVIIFLAAAVTVIAVVLAVLTVRILNANSDMYDELSEKYDELETAHTGIVAYKDAVEEENARLFAENERLSDAVAALNNENRELFAETERLQNDLNYMKTPDTSGTSQRENAQYERLPENIDTNRYDCMGYNFPANTQQAMLQEECFTDPATGIRYWRNADNRIFLCAAMGAAYGTNIGRCFNVTLQNGCTVGVILAEFQHDIDDPDPDDFGEIWLRDDNGNPVERLRNYDGELVCHLLEFVCDLRRIPAAVRASGSMSAVAKFGGIYGDGGNVVRIEHLGRLWTP